MKRKMVSVSILGSSDKLEAVRLLNGTSCDFIHIDVMDGMFVPNITLGAPVVKALRKYTDRIFDVHLMIARPLDYVETFVKCGADCITFHLESDSEPGETIRKIHSFGKKAGLAIKPGTPAEAVLPYLSELDMVLVMSVEPGFGGQKFMENALPKLTFLRKAAPEILLNVDGGINAETGRRCVEAGANILVAGSYVFGASDPSAAIASLR